MRSLIKLAIALVGVVSISLGSAIAADAVNDKCPISGKAADGSAPKDEFVEETPAADAAPEAPAAE